MPAASEAFADAAINQELRPEDKVGLYREMLRSRVFELEAHYQYSWAPLGGFLMLQMGQEAIPVAVRSLMGPLDHSICGMRGIGHALAAGMTMRSAMAELYGKATGAAKGKAGMLGFFATEHRHWGNYAMAGTQAALATGLAFGLKYRGEAGAVCCFLGEGSMNQGVVHESLNLAALFRLPVVFIIENNGYAFCTSESRSSATNGSLAQRAEGYGIPWQRLSGDHIYEIRARAWPVLESARRDHQPAVLEMSTYRYLGFAAADANKFVYRTRAEVEHHQQYHDPLCLWADQLKHEGIATSEHLAMLERDAKAEARDAAVYAAQSPYPRAEAITEDVYWSVDHAIFRNKKPQGRHFF